MSKKILKIYDPALCCSSGVCGPSVDPELIRFANTVAFISAQPGVSVERYNLGQQPQAFVDNETVKTMLTDLGPQALPFIFVDEKPVFKEKYPSVDDLLSALKIQVKNKPPSGSMFPIDPEANSGGNCS